MIMAPATQITRYNNDTRPGWVFGYGSLMWNPGFPHAERRASTLPGFHRAFCIYSQHYRGTPERPGLVLGLDRGGECRGVAFRIAPSDWDEVIAYLDERELIGYAYQPNRLTVTFDDGATAMAHTYTADRTHTHFAGGLTVADSAKLILRAEGIAGTNRDYAIKVIQELESRAYLDVHLHELLERVRQNASLGTGSL